MIFVTFIVEYYQVNSKICFILFSHIAKNARVCRFSQVLSEKSIIVDDEEYYYCLKLLNVSNFTSIQLINSFAVENDHHRDCADFAP